jgi:hypothetical protein
MNISWILKYKLFENYCVFAPQSHFDPEILKTYWTWTALLPQPSGAEPVAGSTPAFKA